MHRPSVRHVARVLATMQGDERRGRFRPDPAFLETTQGGRIRPEWRKQVVQWVREVSRGFRLHTNTHFAAVSFFDRFLSRTRLATNQLQTAALACIFLATKVLETAPIAMADLERLFHKVCTPEKVRAAELMIIMRLEWDTNVFTAYDAMDLLLALDESGDLFRDIRPKAHEILELALEEYALLQWPASVVAVAAIHLAFVFKGIHPTHLYELLLHADISVPMEEVEEAYNLLWTLTGAEQKLAAFASPDATATPSGSDPGLLLSKGIPADPMPACGATASSSSSSSVHSSHSTSSSSSSSSSTSSSSSSRSSSRAVPLEAGEEWPSTASETETETIAAAHSHSRASSFTCPSTSLSTRSLVDADLVCAASPELPSCVDDEEGGGGGGEGGGGGGGRGFSVALEDD